MEGPDLAGKSSVAAELFKLIPERYGASIMVRHFTKPPNCFDRYWGYANCVQRDVILDRFHMSQLAYREVDREPHDLTPFKYELVDAKISLVGGIVVVICPPSRVIQERWEAVGKHRDEMYALDHVLKVAEVFARIGVGSPAGFMTKQGCYRPKIDLYVENAAWSVVKIAEEAAKLWCERQHQAGLLAHSHNAPYGL